MTDLRGHIGVAVWGIGGHSRRTILPAISQNKDLNLVCIGSRSAEKIKVICEQYKCLPATSLQELLELKTVDVVFVATPIGCHADDVKIVLTAGKHVWCEKAFTEHLDDAIKLVKLSRNRDLAICVSCPPIYHPLYRYLASIEEDSIIGRIKVIDAHFGFPHVQEHTKYDPKIGGGALLDVGFYPLVIGTSLCSEPAEPKFSVLEIESGFKVDTAGTSLFRVNTGAHLISKWGYGRDYINEIRIYGESGSLIAAPAFSKPSHRPVKITIQRQNEVEEITVPEANQFEQMLRSFSKAITDKKLREFYRKKAINQQRLLHQVRSLSDGKQPIED